MSTLNVKLTSNGSGIPYGPSIPGIHVSFGAEDYDHAAFRHYCDEMGSVSIENLPDGPFRVHARAIGYIDTYRDIELPRDAAGQIEIPLIKEPLTLSRLTRIDGHRMVNERGEQVYGKGASFFLGYKKHLEGQDLDPQLDQLQELGCNLVRTMGSFESLGGFDPRLYGERYFTEIPAYMARLEQRGIHNLWTACAAIGGIYTNDDDVMRHIRKTVEQLVTCNGSLFSPVNEQGQHNNSINRQRFQSEIVDAGLLQWMLYDTGSFGVDRPCEPPLGKFAVLHTTRTYPGMVKDGNIVDHPNHVHDGIEVGIDEPYRMGDEGSGGDGLYINPAIADEAAGSAYTALFWFVHTMQGERADLLTGNTWDCARAAFAAMKGR